MSRLVIKNPAMCSFQGARLAAQCFPLFNRPEDFMKRDDTYVSVQITDANIDIREDLVDELLDKITSRIHDRMVREFIQHPAFEVLLEIPLLKIPLMDVLEGSPTNMIKGAELSIEIRFRNFRGRSYKRCSRCVQVVGRRQCRSWAYNAPATAV